MPFWSWSPKAQPVTVMCPVEPRLLASLTTTIATLPDKQDGPLRKTGRTHFGRWVVIERLHDEDGLASSDELGVPYLLFTANVDGSVRTYLRELVTTASADMHRVWSHCLGYPEDGGDAALTRYLRRMQLRTNLFFSPYPRATVRQVRSAVSLRASFIGFAVDTDGLGPEELQARFREWYGAQPAKVGG